MLCYLKKTKRLFPPLTYVYQRAAVPYQRAKMVYLRVQQLV